MKIWLLHETVWRVFATLAQSIGMVICFAFQYNLILLMFNFYHPQLSFVQSGVEPGLFKPDVALAAS